MAQRVQHTLCLEDFDMLKKLRHKVPQHKSRDVSFVESLVTTRSISKSILKGSSKCGENTSFGELVKRLKDG